jgi:hypothetical protein
VRRRSIRNPECVRRGGANLAEGLRMLKLAMSVRICSISLLKQWETHRYDFTISRWSSTSSFELSYCRLFSGKCLLRDSSEVPRHGASSVMRGGFRIADYTIIHYLGRKNINSVFKFSFSVFVFHILSEALKVSRSSSTVHSLLNITARKLVWY